MTTSRIDLTNSTLNQIPNGTEVELIFAFDHVHGTVVESSENPETLNVQDSSMGYIWKIFRDNSKDACWGSEHLFALGFGGLRGIWLSSEPWMADDWNREICHS